MSVSPVSSTSHDAVVNAASGYVKQTTGSGSGLSAALSEANETPATTAKEAAKGDPVAKRLLAREQQAKQLQEPAPSQEPGKGAELDQKA